LDTRIGGARVRLAGLLAVLFGAGCTGDESRQSAPSSARDAGGEAGSEIPEGAAHLAVHFARAEGAVGRLIGWNLGRGTYYAPEGDLFHPEWRSPERIAAITKLRDVVAPNGPAPYVRFSGLQIDGSFGGDGYHFWDFVRPDRGTSPADNMAVFEYAAVASELGGELTITLDFGSGTSAEAARYATYLNGTSPVGLEVAARTSSGRKDPYGVSVFEIGNESYGSWNTGNVATGKYSYANPTAANGGDPAWKGKPSSSAADFSARALEYVHAVQAVSPGARFRVPLSQASMDAWGGLDVALAALGPLLEEPAVDAVVVHLYGADDGTTLGVTDVNAPDFVVAASELFRPLFSDLRAKLDALGRQPPLGIAVTEYNVADGFSHGRYLLGSTAAVGLGIADLLVFLAQARVDHACQHLSLSFDKTADVLVEDWYNPLRADGDGGVREMPSFTVTRLFASHVLPQFAVVTPGPMPKSSYQVGAKTYEYDRVHAVAFTEPAGSHGTVFLLNRDLGSPVRITLDLDDGYTVRAVEQWAPPAIDTDAASEIPVTGAPYRQVGRRVEITAPPHSVVAVEASRS
jgi:hypothetical protein